VHPALNGHTRSRLTGLMARAGDILGYTRVSTADQDVQAQEDRLLEAGAIRVFSDVISGSQYDRPGLGALIDHARPGDSLCVTRLGRLGRSLKELLETVDGLKDRQINLISLEENSTRPARRASWSSMSSVL